MNKKSGQKDEVKGELGRPGIKWKEMIKLNLSELDVVDCINFQKMATFLPFYDLFTYVQYLQGGSNMTGTDLYVNKPHCAAAVRP